MELKLGYRQTEVGAIPDDWDVASFDEAFKRVNAKKHQLATAHYQDVGILPVVDQGQDLIVGFTDREELRFTVPASGAVVFGDHTCIVKYVDFDFVVGADGTQVLLGRIGHSARFHAYELERRGIQSTGYNRHFKFLRERVFASPSTDEQSVIATALSDVDALLAAQDVLIAKKRAIKQSAMQELLTGKRRLPGFSGEWEVKCLGSLLESPVTDGPHLTPTFLDRGVPFLSVNNLVDGRIDWSDLRYISHADHRDFSRKCRPRNGDILFGKAASVGMVAYVDTYLEFNIWSPIALIRVDPIFSAKFVFRQLQSDNVKSQVSLLTNSSSQGNIGMRDIERFKIRYPYDREEQDAIAVLIDDFDGEIVALETQRAKTAQLKRGMLQALLTGRIRLV